MGFSVLQWAVVIIGFVVHVAADRSAVRRTRDRVVELALLWVVAGTGAFAIVGGLAHIGPTSDEIAASIGYAQSMFQWELGWADIAIGVLGVGCAWRVNRGGWLTATVVAFVLAYWGDAVGHVMQWVAHGNTAPNNVFVLPGDVLLPALMVVLLVLHRRASRADAGPRVPAARAGEQAPPRRADTAPG